MAPPPKRVKSGTAAIAAQPASAIGHAGSYATSTRAPSLRVDNTRLEAGRSSNEEAQQNASSARTWLSAIFDTLYKLAETRSHTDELFLSGNSSLKSKQLIIRIHNDSYTVTLEPVGAVTATNAPNESEFFQNVIRHNESGALSLVPVDRLRKIADQLEVEIIRAEEDHWQPSELWQPKTESPWAFYERVYLGKHKPSARRLMVTDGRLYNALTSLAADNLNAGLERSPETPHSIHDIFPPRIGPDGRAIHAARKRQKLTLG